MRKIISTLVAAACISSFSVALPTVASAQEYDSSAAASALSQATVKKEGDKTVVESNGQSTVVTTDPMTGEMVIDSGEDVIKVFPEDVDAMQQAFADEAQGISYRAEVEKDWKKYLCGAAAEAAVSGHGAAWQKAIELATKSVKTGKANPYLIAASAVFHLGAGVFLSTQC